MATDLLSSILQVLLPAATGGAVQAARAGPPDPAGPMPPSARFSPDGALRQDRGPPIRPEVVPPPGIAMTDNPGTFPVSDEIKKMFEPAYQPPAPIAPRPAPAPAAPVARPPMAMPAQPMPAQAQQPTGGITGADVQRFIRSVATGAGKMDPRAPGAAAVAQGAMGALQNSYGELEREKAQKLAERRADIADRRADTALDIQRQRDDRAERELARKAKRDEQVEAERQVRTRERLARIAKIDDQRLDSKDIGRIGDQVNRHARYLQVEVNNARMTPEQAEQSLQQYKRDVIEQYVKRDPAAKAPPTAGAKPPASPGTGTRDMPFSFDGLDRDAAQRRFNELKKGQFYVNPADGKIYEKK